MNGGTFGTRREDERWDLDAFRREREREREVCDILKVESLRCKRRLTENNRCVLIVSTPTID